MASSPAARFRFAEVGCIAMHGKDHVACLVCGDGIGMCGGVVQKLVDQCFGVLGWIGLFCG